MDVQLQELIDKIKNDGVKEAESQAASLIEEAQAKAEGIIKAAEDKASEIVKTAQVEAKRMEESSLSSLNQASRDSILNIKKDIESIFTALLKAEIDTQVKGEALAKVIGDVLVNFDKGEELEVFVSEDNLKACSDYLVGALKGKIAEGISIRPSKSISGGFIIKEKDGGVFFDFTDEEIARVLASYMNPRLSQIITDSVKS